MGKAGIFGVMGGFSPLNFSMEERDRILDGILKHRKIPIKIYPKEKAELLNKVAQAAADYCGRVKIGFPPTGGELDAQIAKMQKTAREIYILMDNLEDQINDPSKLTAIDYLHRTMRRNGSSLMKIKAMMLDLSEFRAHLSILAESDHRSSQMGDIPKGWPDPYMEQFMKGLIPVWTQAMGRIPGRIVGHYDEQSEKSLEDVPFVNWIETIIKSDTVRTMLSSTGYKPTASVRLFREIIASEKERVKERAEG